MNRTLHVVMYLWFLALCFGVVPSIQASELEALRHENKKPNILFIYLDDFGWKDVSYMGSDFFETPTLDKLASQGMVFTDAYAGAANCAPSRACLLSGQYSPRHKIYNVGTGPRGKSVHRRLQHIPGVSDLDPKIETWAACLQNAGYRTATMGKWHLSNDPQPYGFDVNVGGTHSGGPPNGYYPPHKKAPGLKNVPKGEYLTDTLSKKACQFIRENKDQPWLLYLTHFAVHTPIQSKKELVAKYSAKPAGTLHQNVKMATMIQAVDDGVSMIQRTLEELAIQDRTIIVFYSDNGGYGPATDMAPLKGYKGTYYEGGIRVPFFVKWPNVVKAGTSTNEPMTAVDVFPTFCEMAGVPFPKQILDGESLVPILDGRQTKLGSDESPRSIFWHFPAYLQSYRQVVNEQRDPLFRSRPCSIIRKGKWKLHQYFEDNSLELYDLESDIGEAKNLAASNPEMTKTLLAELKAWQRKSGADIPGKANPDFDEAKEKAAIKNALTSKKKTRR